jgi:type II secretory pathway pseudopilin PulG
MNHPRNPPSFRQMGVSLVELIMFIVIVAVLAVGLFSVLANSLRGVPQAGQTDWTAEIAQQRMELILAQRRAVGFATFADPCPGAGPAVCTPPTGYGVSSNIVTGWGSDPLNYKVIMVTVTGPFTVTATALAANY